jgi:hypothetical protein
VAELIDLEHWRRALRLVPILVDRFGAAHFVDKNGGFARDKLARCVALACEWIARRSGRDVDDDFRPRVERLLKSVVRERVREASARRS